MRTYSPINTFTQSPSPAQIISYLLFLAQILVFSIIIQKNYESSVIRIVFCVTYSVIVAAHLLTVLFTSWIDPSDPLMVKFKNNRDDVKNEQIHNTLYCDMCRSYVNKSSKHCRSCCRCVQNFDHHCIWLNNCIGKGNYRIFFIMIIFTLLSMLTFELSIIFLWLQHKFQYFIVQMGVVWAFGLIVCVFILLICNLIVLHVYLWWNELTTYEFIVNGKKDKVKQQQQIKQQHEVTKMELIQITNKQKKKDQTVAIQIQETFKQDIQHQQSDGNIGKSQGSEISEAKGDIDEKEEKYGTSGKKIVPLKVMAHDKNNIFEEDQDNASSSSLDTVKISQFFKRNKSLKILTSIDVLNPEKPKNHVFFPRTCQNSALQKAVNSRKNAGDSLPV